MLQGAEDWAFTEMQRLGRIVEMAKPRLRAEALATVASRHESIREAWQSGLLRRTANPVW